VLAGLPDSVLSMEGLGAWWHDMVLLLQAKYRNAFMPIGFSREPSRNLFEQAREGCLVVTKVLGKSGLRANKQKTYVFGQLCDRIGRAERGSECPEIFDDCDPLLADISVNE
jgi:hypothetical protein